MVDPEIFIGGRKPQGGEPPILLFWSFPRKLREIEISGPRGARIPDAPWICHAVTHSSTGRGGRCGGGGMYLRAGSGREKYTETDNGSVVNL